MHVESLEFAFIPGGFTIERNQQRFIRTYLCARRQSVDRSQPFQGKAETGGQMVKSLAFPGVIGLPADQRLVVVCQIGLKGLDLIDRQQDEVAVVVQNDRAVMGRIESDELFAGNVSQLGCQFHVDVFAGRNLGEIRLVGNVR